MRFNMHRRWVDQFISLMNSGSVRSLNLYRRCLYNFRAAVGNVNSECKRLSRLPTSYRAGKTVVPTHVLRVYWVNYWEAAIASLESINMESLIFRLDSTSALIFQGLWTSECIGFPVLLALEAGRDRCIFRWLFGTHRRSLCRSHGRDETSTAELSNIRAVRNLLCNRS